MDWEIPNEFVIKFSEGHEINLVYIEETNGICKYGTSFIARDSLKNGEKTNLIITIEHSLLTEEEKVFYNVT